MQDQKKVSVITGAAQGIGRAIAMACAKQGHRVVICDLDETKMAAAVQDAKQAGAEEAVAIKLNVANAAEAKAMSEKVVEVFGRIDVLVNNAGITRDTLAIRMKEEDWDAVIAVNLKGTFNCSKAVALTMMKQRFGRIVNLASVVGMMGNAGQANYAASKAGVIGLTKTFAKELASRNITVNAIAPGFITTAMTDKLPEEVKAKMLEATPLGRFGTPEDVANVVMFLIGDSANYMTGQVLRVDGGLVMA